MVEISEGDDPLLLRQRMVPGTELKTILSNAKRWRGRKRLRGFYEAQNSQIARFLIPLSTLKVMEDDDHERKKRKRYKLLIDLTLFSTLLISAIQIYAAILSRSSSIALITVDSVIDILAGAVVKLSNAKIRRVDQNKYPCGGSRFRSIGNVCYAFLMMTANIYVASESAKAILTSSGEDINKDLKSIIPPSISLS